MSDGFEYCRKCEYFDNTNLSCPFWGESCYGTTFCAVKLRKRFRKDCKFKDKYKEQEHEGSNK